MNERERLFHSFLMLSRSPAESNLTYVVDSLDAYLEAKYSDIVSDGKLDPSNKFDAPPQRPWVGLTEEELIALSESGLALWELWKAIEAKLKEKNK